MKKILILLVLVLLVGGYWLMNKAETPVAPSGETAEKLDMQVVCESALVYMTFPTGEASAEFVADCMDGQYPEVIERYKIDMGIGAEAEV